MQALIPPPCASDPIPGSVGPHHRRAHSDLPIRVVDTVMAGADGALPDFGSEDDLFHMYLDMENAASEAEAGPDPDLKQTQPKHHRQSLSVGGYGYGCGSGEAKKAMAPEKLAELAVVDPKRVKRILANRQSAARSKERKARYISDLERKVQGLQIELATLSAQLSLLQRDTMGLATENNELMLRLQVMEQQAHLHDALNQALMQEVERLKFATGEAVSHANACNMRMQQFPIDESHLPCRQQQQNFSFHQGIQSPRPEFHQPPQPHPPFPQQPQPTFSNQQMHVEQHHDHSLLNFDCYQLPDIMMPQAQLGKMRGLDINNGSQVMQPYQDCLISPKAAIPTDLASQFFLFIN